MGVVHPVEVHQQYGSESVAVPEVTASEAVEVEVEVTAPVVGLMAWTGIDGIVALSAVKRATSASSTPVNVKDAVSHTIGYPPMMAARCGGCQWAVLDSTRPAKRSHRAASNDDCVNRRTVHGRVIVYEKYRRHQTPTPVMHNCQPLSE